ncbi:hypothetical protein H0H87_010371 [Tephrocybe sp. NHM501043]|nr:hypothetical protein H0H87_010371 [Tephrocybe sp. NHM501043]
MAPTPIERPIQLYDIRRRHFVLLLHDQMPIYYDLHARNPSSAPYRTVKVSAYPPALQAKLDKKELHHRRLVALFSIVSRCA